MTRCVNVGGIPVGGENRITVQTMTTVKTSDIDASIREIESSVMAGADIVRVAIRDEADALALKELTKMAPCPIVADIHFNPKLAILSAQNGAAKIRLNPGNIGGKPAIKAVSEVIKDLGIPVRVGSNSGSIEEEYLRRYGRSAEALAESALASAAMLEEFGVENIVLAAKATDVPTTVRAYELLHERCDYPLHIGVTEAGFGESGIIKGAVGIGSLLLSGIGDTIRVSLTAPPEEEARIGREILRAVGLDRNYAEIISCPTCGRCDYDVASLARKIKKATQNTQKPIKIAIMGCVVNGIGEGGNADVGIAGGSGACVIFRKGQIVRKVPPEAAESALLCEIQKLLTEKD